MSESAFRPDCSAFLMTIFREGRGFLSFHGASFATTPSFSHYICDFSSLDILVNDLYQKMTSMQDMC